MQLGAVLSDASTTQASILMPDMTATLDLMARLAKVAFGLLGIAAGAAGISYAGGAFSDAPAQSLLVAVQALNLPPAPAANPAAPNPAGLAPVVPAPSALLSIAGPVESAGLDSQVLLPASPPPTPPGGALNSSAAEVPEPSSLPLLLLVAPLALLARRRH
jgi:hypothetical protein